MYNLTPRVYVLAQLSDFFPENPKKRDFSIFRPILNPIRQPHGGTLDPADWRIRIHREKCYQMAPVSAINLFEGKFTKVLNF